MIRAMSDEQLSASLEEGDRRLHEAYDKGTLPYGDERFVRGSNEDAPSEPSPMPCDKCQYKGPCFDRAESETWAFEQQRDWCRELGEADFQPIYVWINTPSKEEEQECESASST